VLVKLGNYKAATSHLEKAITHYATDFDTNFYLGEAHRGLDKYSEAIFRYKVALSVQPDAPKALKPLAWSYFKIRYYSEALLSARRLHKIAPKDSQAPIILSRTLLKLKRPNEAITLLKKAKAHVAANTLPYYQSVEGDLLYEKGDLDGAMKAYRAALKDRPLLAGALLGLGRCLYDKGKTKKALTFMQRAVRIQPRLTEAYYLLGRALEKTDRQKSKPQPTLNSWAS
jgi:tetratricopeptide (TPR) repeat protein